MVHRVDDPEYPKEWVKDDDGSNPRCTAHEPKPTEPDDTPEQVGKYEPELGQAVFGRDSEAYGVPEHGKALLMYLLSEVGQVYWNCNQKEWEWSEMPDPQIPGLQVRPYNWSDDDAPPNFVFGGVAIRWYKHPGRGLSCNRGLNPDEWVKWFGECLAAIHAKDDSNDDAP